MAIERTKVFDKSGNMQVDTLWQSGYLKKIKKVRIKTKEQNKLFGDFSSVDKRDRSLDCVKTSLRIEKRNKFDRILYQITRPIKVSSPTRMKLSTDRRTLLT